MSWPQISICKARFGVCLLCAAWAAAAVTTPAKAQTPLAVNSTVDSKAMPKVRELHPRPIQSPIALDGPLMKGDELTFLTPDAMSDADQTLVAANESEIARRASLAGLHLDQSGLAYEQAVCPVFPNHLILDYSYSSGPGDLTLFAAVIPRSGEGHVRVIPVQRRGYTLFTLAKANELTIHDFNHVVTEEGNGLSSDWAGLALCYEAMAGGHARAGMVTDEQTFPLPRPSMLQVNASQSGATIWLTETGTMKGNVDKGLVMRFDGKGRLVKVKLEKVPAVYARTLGAPLQPKVRAAVASPVDLTPR